MTLALFPEQVPTDLVGKVAPRERRTHRKLSLCSGQELEKIFKEEAEK